MQESSSWPRARKHWIRPERSPPDAPAAALHREVDDFGALAVTVLRGGEHEPLLDDRQRDDLVSFRQLDTATPIIGGGGILSCDDADVILRAGANAISLGCVSMLRPWRVQSIIKHVNARIVSERVYESFGVPSPYRK